MKRECLGYNDETDFVVRSRRIESKRGVRFEPRGVARRFVRSSRGPGQMPRDRPDAGT